MRKLGMRASQVLIAVAVVVVGMVAAWLIGLSFAVMAVLVAVVLVGAAGLQHDRRGRGERWGGTARFLLLVVAGRVCSRTGGRLW